MERKKQTNIVLKEENLALIDRACSLQNRTRSSFIGYYATKRAKEVIDEESEA